MSEEKLNSKLSSDVNPEKVIPVAPRQALRRCSVSVNSASEIFSSDSAFRSKSVVASSYEYENYSAHGPVNVGTSFFPLSAESPCPPSAEPREAANMLSVAQPLSDTRDDRTTRAKPTTRAECLMTTPHSTRIWDAEASVTATSVPRRTAQLSFRRLHGASVSQYCSSSPFTWLLQQPNCRNNQTGTGTNQPTR